MVTRLDPPIPLVTPRGDGLAHLVIDYGIDHDLMWVVFQRDGQVWTYSNRDVRAVENLTIGRMKPSLGELVR